MRQRTSGERLSSSAVATVSRPLQHCGPAAAYRAVSDAQAARDPQAARATVLMSAAKMTTEALRAAAALHVRSLLHECRPVSLFTPPARVADGVCDNTGVGARQARGRSHGPDPYGFMLPPGVFQASHSSTRSSAGCLARYPPARVWMRVTGLAGDVSAGG